MGRLIYSMITSVDGYASAPDGSIDWGGADADLHTFIAGRMQEVGTYLYGRRIYELMSYWETALDEPDQPAAGQEFARVWQSADKVVYSRTHPAVTTARTTLERHFDPAEVRRRVDALDHDVTIEGPTLAALALRAGIVDEVQPYVAAVALGGGQPFYPPDLRLDLELLDEHRFSSGTVWLRYRVAQDRAR
ncbi:dihydrofolate reductase family protein [Cellulomonas sp. Marseille-Q8402]